MKSLSKNGLSDLQLITLIFVATSGTNIIFLPRILAEEAGRDGWIGIVLGGFVALVLAGLIYLLCSRFPRRILPEFSMLILGKPLGLIVSAVYVAYTLLLGSTTLMLFKEVAKTWTVFWTPQSVFIASMLIAVIFIVRQGPVPLGRLSELIFYTIIFVVLLLFLPLPQLNIMHLKPVGEEGLTAIISAARQTSFAYLGIEVLLVFFPFFMVREKVLRLYLLSVTLLILFYTILTLLTYALLGAEFTRLQVWPLMKYLSVGRMQIIERIDNLFLFMWIMKIIGLVAVQYYAAAVTAAAITNKRYFGLWTLLLLPIMFVVTNLPAQQHAIFEIAHMVGTWGTVFVVGLVLLLLIVALIRGLDERKEIGKP